MRLDTPKSFVQEVLNLESRIQNLGIEVLELARGMAGKRLRPRLAHAGV